MKYARFSNILIFRNWRALFAFELFYKFLIIAGFTPLVKRIIYLSMSIAGIKYLGNDNYLRYFLNPLVLIILFLLLLIILFITFFDIIAVIEALDASYHKQTVTFRQLIRKAAVKSCGIFYKTNWKFALYVLFILPATGIMGYGSFISSLELPGFIRDFASNRIFLSIGFVILAIVLLFFSFKWIFSLHFYTLEDCDYKKAVVKSANLIKGNIPRTVFSMACMYIRIFVLITSAAIIAGTTAFMLTHFRTIYDPNGDIMQNAVVWTIYLLVLFFSSVTVPLSFSIVSSVYYGLKRTADTGEEPSFEELCTPDTAYTPLPPLSKLILSEMLLGMFALLIWQFSFGTLSNYDTTSIRPAIVAHRGNSADAPENSIAAFERSIEEGVKWIELDVHQTKDGVIVVTHDANISRICGVNKNVYDLTYEELISYDSGSWFSEEFSYLHVATLAEVIELCKDRAHLQIEIKPTGHETDFEQGVIDIIRQYGFEEQCVIASMDLNTLKKCEDIAPELESLYIMVIAAGNISSLDYIDGFSIEATFVTDTIIRQIHDARKNCYVWTINNSKYVRKLLENNVDGILTDQPVKIQQEVDAYFNNDPLKEIINILTGKFFE